MHGTYWRSCHFTQVEHPSSPSALHKWPSSDPSPLLCLDLSILNFVYPLHCKSFHFFLSYFILYSFSSSSSSSSSSLSFSSSYLSSLLSFYFSRFEGQLSQVLALDLTQSRSDQKVKVALHHLTTPPSHISPSHQRNNCHLPH